MKDIIFGMAVGGIIGILLYKNNSLAKELFDKNEKIIMKEIDKMDLMQSPKKPAKENKN